MKYDPDRNHRRSIRLKEYNYSQVGAYFVTICTQNRELLLDDVGIRLMVQKWWDALPEKFPDIRTDQFVIMPNHIHGIIFIVSVGADQSAQMRAITLDCPYKQNQHWEESCSGSKQ